MKTDSFAFLHQDVESAAKALLGCILERKLDGQLVRVRIVEVEAYDQNDAASHSYKGKTPRTDVMFGPSGHLYVYFTYGMHYCCNVVTGPEGMGAAVLIRAVEPLEGENVLQEYRPFSSVQLTNGPAKLCQALGINKTMNGHDLSKTPLRLIVRPPLDSKDFTQTTRIGITQSKDVPWRFYITGNPFVSRP